MKTLVLVFHPALASSTVNRQLAQSASQNPEVTVRDMYQLYPDFKIDAEAEKNELEKADRIVLQFPMYWYSSPALVKQWEDDVLQHGWAYGSNGNKLKGKELLIAVTPGASAENYVRNQNFKYEVNDLLRPFQATSNLISTKFVKPFIVTGASSIQSEALTQAGKDYENYLTSDLTILGDYE